MTATATATVETVVARMRELRTELDALLERVESEELTDEELQRVDTISTELLDLDEKRETLANREARVERVRQIALDPASHEDGGNRQRQVELDGDFVGGDASHRSGGLDPFDGLDTVQRIQGLDHEDAIARARKAVETVPGSTDARRELLTRMLEGSAWIQQDHDGDLARMVLTTTSPVYLRAWSKYLKDREASCTPEERAALDRAKDLQRAMSTTDAAGGYFIPTHIDPAVVATADGNANPIFELSRVVPTTSDTLRAVGSGNASWSWDAENAEVSDDATTFSNTDIPLYTGRGFVPVSIEAIASIENVQAVVEELLLGGHDDLVSAAVTTGTGSSQPTGIITAIAAATPVTSATTDVFAVADVYSTLEDLGPKYRANGRATWLSNIAIANDIRAFATDDGHALWARMGDGTPGALLGHSWRECSNMDGSVTAMADNYVLILGDFRYYWIGVGIGMTVENVPQVFGSNGRPIGARGWFAYHRFGADSVNDNAFALLNVT